AHDEVSVITSSKAGAVNEFQSCRRHHLFPAEFRVARMRARHAEEAALGRFVSIADVRRGEAELLQAERARRTHADADLDRLELLDAAERPHELDPAANESARDAVDLLECTTA